MYYPSSENKGADQLRGYREADLRLCFRLCRLLVFPRGGSIILMLNESPHQKPTNCICENAGADQLRGNCEVDQRLCVSYTDSTVPPLFIQNFKILAFFCYCIGRFESDLFGIHIVSFPMMRLKCLINNDMMKNNTITVLFIFQ